MPIIEPFFVIGHYDVHNLRSRRLVIDVRNLHIYHPQDVVQVLHRRHAQCCPIVPKKTYSRTSLGNGAVNLTTSSYLPIHERLKIFLLKKYNKWSFSKEVTATVVNFKHPLETLKKLKLHSFSRQFRECQSPPIFSPCLISSILWLLALFGLDVFTKALEDIVVIRTRVLTDWYARVKKS